MTIIRHFSTNFVLLCCFTWTAGKIINPQATKLNCTVDSVNGFCSDCLNQIICSKENVATNVQCPTTQVCQEVSGFSTCVNSVNVPECECPITGVEQKADFYDDEKFIICLEGTPHIEHCKDGKIVNPQTGECVAPPTTTTNEPTITPLEKCPDGEFAKVAVSCTQYRYCLSNGDTSEVLNCNLGEIFDTETDECKFYAPFSCTNRTNGYYTDTTNCSIFHLCIDGSTYDEITCSNGEYFDEEIQECRSPSDVKCNALKDCGICPDAETFIQINECTSFYKCSVNTDAATKDELPYIPVYDECPSGTCFNAQSGYCEF
ncbi:UNVERIFIED_CONTAM: hypothetical protein RMT77_003379 [Armadillidium vulgare]